MSRTCGLEVQTFRGADIGKRCGYRAGIGLSCTFGLKGDDIGL